MDVSAITQRGSGPARCTILLLTEDSGRDGVRTLEIMVKCMLRELVEQGALPKIDIQPLQNEDAMAAMRGNVWKSSNSRDEIKRRRLCREIAGMLCQADGFVVFPVREAREVGKSFAHAIRSLEQCEALMVFIRGSE